jgi:hypothetical protein
LSLSRIELNEHTRRPVTSNWLGVLRNVANALEMKAKSRGMTIRIEAEIAATVDRRCRTNLRKCSKPGRQRHQIRSPQYRVRIVARPAEDASARVPRRIARGGVAVSVIDAADGMRASTCRG